MTDEIYFAERVLRPSLSYIGKLQCAEVFSMTVVTWSNMQRFNHTCDYKFSSSFVL